MSDKAVDHQDNEPNFIVYADRKRLLLTIIFSSLIVITGAVLTFMAATTPAFDGEEIGVRIFGVLLCSLFFIMIMPLFYSLKRWHRNAPEISITNEEIYVWAWSDTPIKWSNVDEIISHHVGFSKLISLKLINPLLNPPRKKTA